MMNMGAQLGGACTAWVTPIIAAQFGWGTSFAAAAALAACGGLAWLLVDPNQQLPVVQRADRGR